MDPNQLTELLGALRSADNEARKAAEASYEQLAAAQPAQVMYALAQFCVSSQDASSVSLALILLRKLFNTTHETVVNDATVKVSVFSMVEPEVQQTVKQSLLQVLGTAAYGPQRGSAASCVSALVAAMHKSQQSWDDLWNSIFQILSADASDVELKTICCEIIATVGINVSKFLETHRAALASGLHRCLATQGGNTKALKEAAFNVITALAPIGFKDDFVPLVPDMLNSIQSCLNAQQWEDAETLLIAIVQCTSDAPQLFQTQATPLLSGLMQAAATVEVPKNVRHVAVEALLTFCEESPKTARKVPQFTSSFFELLFQYTLSPEMDENWDTTPSLEADTTDLDEVTDFLVGTSGLDRLATAIGGRKLKDTAQRLFTEGIQSPDWKHRFAALVMLAHILTGMLAAFDKQFPALLAAALPFVQDEVKYVRTAAIECISQLCSDFCPEAQMVHHNKILPPIVNALRDPIPNVSGAAARCLDSFFDSFGDEADEENEDPEATRMYTPYLRQICEDCVVVLQSSMPLKIREAALGALSSVVSTMKSHMTPYVAQLAPVFQSVLDQSDSPEIMEAKCKAIECITLLACGVGKEVMGPYALQICEFLKRLCVEGLTNDDPRFRFVLRGWTCMVECLREDAMPYVQGIMPMLLSLVDLDCDLVITDTAVGEDDDEALQAEEAAGVEVVRVVVPGVGERIAKMHTGLIEDKELASNVLNAILMELGTNMVSFFPSIAHSAIKLLSFKVNDSIRESGGLMLTAVMEGYEELKSPDAQGLASEALQPLLDALAEEPDADIAGTLMECVSHCVYCAPNIVTAENVEVVGQKIGLTLDVMVKKRRSIMEKIANEKDEDELDDLHAEDEDVSDKIRSTTNLLGTLLERASAVFTPYFSARFFPIVAQWLQPQEDDFFVSRALAIICDFVEFSPQAVAPVLPTLLSSSIAFANSRTDESLLQCDFYLINNLLQYLGNNGGSVSGVNGQEFATQAQGVIANYLCLPDAASKDYLSATCNAASAYVSLVQYFSDSLGPAVTSQILQTLVSVLPCDEDEVEAKRVHERVLGWIVNQHPAVVANAGMDRALLSRLRAAKPSNLNDATKQQLASM